MGKRELGGMGETMAAQYLAQQGYQILERNFRIRSGEIDIIACKQDCLVFVEVKTRRSKRYGTAAEAVHYYKQQKIIQTAQFYLLVNKVSYNTLRFDVVEVYLEQDKPFIHHIIHAFEAKQ